MTNPSVARRYARFILGLALDQVPPSVTAKAALLALDTLGSCLASSREDFGRAVLEAAERLGGAPESTLIGTKSRSGAASATLANATLAHGLDFDDTREDAIVHTGCVAVTTALAVGEALGASGRAVLEAMIAGVEVMCRVGLAVPGRFHARHYHPTSLTGSFAAATVAGKLYGLTEDQQVRAFGICGSQAGGIIESLPTARGPSACIPAGPLTRESPPLTSRAPASPVRKRSSRVPTAFTRPSPAATRSPSSTRSWRASAAHGSWPS